jgi:hypothetical protein
MITIALIFLFIVTISGLVAIERAVKNARPAYEDETGFHFESDDRVVATENLPVRRPHLQRTFRPSAIDGDVVGHNALPHNVGFVEAK